MLDDVYNQWMQSATKMLALRFKMKEFMTVEEWTVLSGQMLASGGQDQHGSAAPKTGY